MCKGRDCRGVSLGRPIWMQMLQMRGFRRKVREWDMMWSKRRPEVVKDVGAVSPDVGRAIFAQALVIEAIDLHVEDYSQLVQKLTSRVVCSHI